MREIGHIPAPDRLAASLRSYSRAAQEKGEALFNSGAVRSVWAVRPGAEFAAEIEGDMQEAVILAYDSRKGSWQGDCGCALGQGCQHVFAAAKALLAEHSLAMVNSLAAGTRTGNPLPPTGSELARALEAKCGRPLTAQEITYIRAVTLFTRCRQTSVIGLTEADLLELGFRLQLRSGDRFQPWEELPHSEVLFWSFIAQGAASAKNPIPPFMHPVTELAEVNVVSGDPASTVHRILA